MNKEYGLKVIVRKEDGVLVGHAGIVPQTINGRQEYEIGYWIAREYWGKGMLPNQRKLLWIEGKTIRN